MTPAPAESRIRQNRLSEEQVLNVRNAAPPEANRFFPGTEPIGAEDKLIMLVLTKRSYTMRAAFPPVSFSVWRLSSATTSSKSVFLRHQSATRLAATCLLFTLAMMMVPKADISETLFDEANTPTNEIVVEKLLLYANLDSRSPRLCQKKLRSGRGCVSTGSHRFTQSC